MEITQNKLLLKLVIFIFYIHIQIKQFMLNEVGNGQIRIIFSESIILESNSKIVNFAKTAKYMQTRKEME